MKTEDLDHWFNFSHWTFEQAAYLFNNIDPSDENHIIGLNRGSHSIVGGKYFNALEPFNKTLLLLKGTDFSECSNPNIPAGSIALTSIFKLAKEKKIGTHTSHLVKVWESRLKHSAPVPEQISENTKMQETLQPIIDLINEFAESSVFLKHREKIQQSLITDWLKEQKLPKHQERHIKELITSFYSIETSRRK
jgi:hypothetical protein